MSLFQHQQSRNRGFTLIELLIVMVIVAMMVTMVVLNVNLGRGDSDLKNFSRRLHAVMQLASEEAILFNKPVGLGFEDTKYTFYKSEKRQPPPPPPPGTPPPPVNNSPYQWEAVALEEGQKKSKRDVFLDSELPEYHEFEVYIDGDRLVIEDAFDLREIDGEPVEVVPSIVFDADGEIYPEDFEINIKVHASEKSATIKVNEDGELTLSIDDGAES